MKYVLSAMPAYMRLSLAGMFQYRGEIILWAVWGVIYPAVGIAVWGAAAAGRQDGSAIAGYGAGEFAAYFLLTMIVGHFCTAWDVYEMGHSVRTGSLSAMLLRPILPIWHSFSDNLAYKTLTLVVLVPIWIVVALITQPTLKATSAHLIYGSIALVLASLISFLWGYVAATAAFWITRMDAVSEMWFGLSLFFGGRLAPLDLLPLPLQWVAVVLPFKWIIWFPSAALAGTLAIGEVVTGLFWQMGWLTLGVVVFQMAWKAGTKQYAAVGA